VTGLREEIERKYQAARRIHTVLVEVTHRCPCNCTHCFLVRTPTDEMSLDEIADLLRQLREEGAFTLGFTGGEPFLREDLPLILEMARKDRFFTSILTTGILVGPPEVNLLRRLKVGHLEMSLLGAGPETHDAIMRHPGAFDRMVRAVKRLREANVGVCLKATIMRPNWHELGAMAALAKDLGVRFSASVSVAPRVDGDRSPQQLALSEAEIARLTPAMIDGGLIPGEEHGPGGLLTCNAGTSVAGISPQGDVFPCILFRRAVGTIRERTLQDIWHDHPDPFLDELRRVKPEAVAECFTCELRPHCRRCPGVAYLETGGLGLPSASACATARARAAARRASGAQASTAEDADADPPDAANRRGG